LLSPPQSVGLVVEVSVLEADEAPGAVEGPPLRRPPVARCRQH
jgi:hypothetical protein